MRVGLVVITSLLVLVLASGCAADPRNEADAYQTRVLADQAAADRQLERSERSVEFRATSAARVAGWQRFYTWASVAACIAIGGLGVGSAWAAVVSGRAVARFAELRAGLIPLAESTRQFPLVASYVGKGRVTLANPNSGVVLYLDTRRGCDRESVARAGAVQLAGAVAREARRSNDAAGVSVIPGQVVEIGRGVTHE
jgi:hypothetical protein